jgi:hypothetical protein
MVITQQILIYISSFPNTYLGRNVFDKLKEKLTKSIEILISIKPELLY